MAGSTTGRTIAQGKASRGGSTVGPSTVALGILAAGLVAARLADVALPLVSTDRAALVALFVAGFALCAAGPLGRLIESKAWLSPFLLFGVGSGIVALAAFGAYLLRMPPADALDDRMALVYLAAAIAVKLAVGAAYRLTRRA